MKLKSCSMIIPVFSFVLLGTLPNCASMPGAELREKELLHFNSPAVLQQFAPIGARMEFVPASGKQKAALKFVAEGSGPAKIKLIPPSANSWNWHGYSALGVELENPADYPVSFGILLSEVGEKKRSAGNGGQLGARSQFALAVPIGSALPMSHGMRGGPPFPGFIPPPFTAMFPIDEVKLGALEIEIRGTQAGRALILSRLVLLPTVSYDKIVDRFGQYTRAEWPGKVHKEEELIEQRKREESEFKTMSSLPDRDEFGGWQSGPQLPARGFFSTILREDKWWLVTPSGHLFLSFGVNSIRTDEADTLITGRESMFSWLPDGNDLLARRFKDTQNILYGPIRQGKSYNFYLANLQRKYGEDYESRFLETVTHRLRSWGFNTIANCSDPRLYSFHRVPYTATLKIEGDFARISSGNDYWGKMTDPFDPRFREAVRRCMEQQTEKYLQDPWCIGYFIDNEISWGDAESDLEHYGLATGTLKEAGNSPAKQALIHLLQQRYPSIEALNEGWGTHFKSWELSAEEFSSPDLSREKVKADFSSFLKEHARQYFRVIKECLAATDPHHLYLGCRFAWRTPEAVEAAGEFCDVVSFNIYERELNRENWAFTLKLNKPCIIGEFHFGATDRGMFHTGLVAAHDQKERAQMYAGYIRSVVDHPAFVGCGWFQYMDEPLTGRTYDGENFSIGFVNVTDAPCPEMIEAARQAHAEAYLRRARRP